MVSEVKKARLLRDCRKAAEAMEKAQEAAVAAKEARRRALVAADDAKVPREEIAGACGLQWPLSRARWSQIRRGVNG